MNKGTLLIVIISIGFIVAGCSETTTLATPTGNVTIQQHKECWNKTYYRWVQISRGLNWSEENQTWYNITRWEKVKQQKTVCRKIPVFTIIKDTEKKRIDFRNFGNCKLNLLEKCIVCDSKLDGNADGVCQSGETCLKYCIDKSGSMKKYQKNSRNDFVESDRTFHLRTKIPRIKQVLR